MSQDPGSATTGAPRAQLPFNRKERFFTGTVLPMLIAGDGFAQLDRFLTLCGLSDVLVGDSLERGALQFLTEYGFAESVYTEQDRTRWPDDHGRDTPDIVIAGTEWLLAVEAKMFHTPSHADLDQQMRAQAAVIRSWVDTLRLPEEHVRHVLLLPHPLAESVRPRLSWPIIEWESVLDCYRQGGPAHWVEVLDTALHRYPELASRPSDTHAQARLTGAQILVWHLTGSSAFDHMGRRGGLDGVALTADISHDSWRTTTYEVRAGALPGNPNWFPIRDFVTRITG